MKSLRQIKVKLKGEKKTPAKQPATSSNVPDATGLVGQELTNLAISQTTRASTAPPPVSGNTASTTTSASRPDSGVDVTQAGETDPVVSELNLWQRALEKVEETKPGLSKELEKYGLKDVNQTDTIKVQDLLNELSQQCEASKKEQWRVPLVGKNIKVQDVIDKSILWLNKFKDWTDMVGKSGPKEVSIACAVMKLVVTMATANVEERKVLLSSIEKITIFVTRCKLYELYYLTPQNSSPEQAQLALEKAVTDIYAKILEFVADAAKLRNKGVIQRNLSIVMSPDRLQSFLTDCQNLDERLHKDAALCEAQRSRIHQTSVVKGIGNLKKALDQLEEPVLRIDDRVEDLYILLNDNERNQILRWVSDTPYEHFHDIAKKGHVSGTGEWLLAEPRYKEWCESSSSRFLWLHGIPGAGKTKLTAHVVEDLMERQRNGSGNIAVAYFYCNRLESGRNDPIDVVRSYVRQLSICQTNTGVDSKLMEVYTARKRNGFASDRLKFEECQDMLQYFIDVYPQSIILVLDALDECNPDLRRDLVALFDDLVNKCSSVIKIFISSRLDDDIRHRFESGPNIAVSATKNHEDIANFVEAEISAANLTRPKPILGDLRAEIVETLLKKSQGMFQWAVLQIRQILELKRPADIKERLGKLPKDLEAAYEDIYKRIISQPGSYPAIAERAFKWLLCSFEPFTEDMLVAAVCQNPDDDNLNEVDIDSNDILAACCNLLVLHEYTFEIGEWSFAHLSIAEYLENKYPRLLAAHDLVARTCLSILCCPDLLEHSEYCRTACELALLHWMDQFDNRTWFLDGSEEEDRWKYLTGLELLEESYDGAVAGQLNTKSLISRLRCLPNYSAKDKHKHRFDLEDSREIDCNTKTVAQSRRLLKYVVEACFRHIQRCAELRGGIDCWHRFKDFVGLWQYNSIYYRRWCLLIRTIARTIGNIVFECCRASPSSAFAVCGWGIDEFVAGWWDDPDMNVNMTDSQGTSLLQVCAGSEQFRVCKELLERGANVDVEGGRLGSALNEAHSEAVVRLLLEHGSHASSHDRFRRDYGYRCDVLHRSIHKGITAKARLLLEYGADANCIRLGGSALCNAVRQRDVTMARLLLDHGADVNLLGVHGDSALCVAAHHYEMDAVVRLLLDHGADVNLTSDGGESALYAAASDGNEVVVRLLLDHGADVNHTLDGGESALYAAARGGYEVVVRLLLDHGAPINLPGGVHGCALQAATCRGQEQTVRLLLRSGADVNLQGGEYGCALQAAIIQGNRALIELLLQHGADINLQGGLYSCPLEAATEYAVDRGGLSIEILQFLLDSGADVNLRDEQGQTVLKRVLEADRYLRTSIRYKPGAWYVDQVRRRRPVVLLLLQAGAVTGSEDQRLLIEYLNRGIKTHEVLQYISPF